MSIFWHETYDNVTSLARWLIVKRNFDVEALQLYYEKPWHWSFEWEEYQGKYGAPV